MAVKRLQDLVNIVDLGEEDHKRLRVEDEEFNERRRAFAVAAGVAAVVANLKLFNEEKKMKSPSEKRDRLSVKAKILSMNPATFKRHYRLDRPTFMALLSTISPSLEPTEVGKRVATNASGSYVEPIIQLAITLRMLAGGSYLDISFGYNISEKEVYNIFHKVLIVLDMKLDNIDFPYEDEEKLRDLESTFSKISKGNFRGTVAAGDGIVFRTIKPDVDAVDGNVRSFFTRKGFYAHALQAFCDGNCKFTHISMKVCASTHDGTAYVLTGLSQRISEGKLAEWAHVVLDDAYVCSNQELSPWRGKNLTPEKDTFNYFLSLHRQTIERAFGMLVRRWGILWRALRFGVKINSRIISVCCKLHNLCIDAFGENASNIQCSSLDTQWERGENGTPDAAAWFTDGVTVRRGSRTDLHTSSTRERLTAHLSEKGLRRPRHSLLQKTMRRIADL